MHSSGLFLPEGLTVGPNVQGWELLVSSAQSLSPAILLEFPFSIVQWAHLSSLEPPVQTIGSTYDTHLWHALPAWDLNIFNSTCWTLLGISYNCSRNLGMRHVHVNIFLATVPCNSSSNFGETLPRDTVKVEGMVALGSVSEPREFKHGYY